MQFVIRMDCGDMKKERLAMLLRDVANRLIEFELEPDTAHPIRDGKNIIGEFGKLSEEIQTKG